MTIQRSLIVFMTLLSLSLVLAEGRSRAQTNAVRTRVTQAVDMRNLVTLRGSVHPLQSAQRGQPGLEGVERIAGLGGIFLNLAGDLVEKCFEFPHAAWHRGSFRLSGP